MTSEDVTLCSLVLEGEEVKFQLKQFLENIEDIWKRGEERKHGFTKFF